MTITSRRSDRLARTDCTVATRSGWVIDSTLSECLMGCFSSSGGDRGLVGTITAPIFAAANQLKMNSGQFVRWRFSLSPFLTPNSKRPFAVWLTNRLTSEKEKACVSLSASSKTRNVLSEWVVAFCSSSTRRFRFPMMLMGTTGPPCNNVQSSGY